MKVAKQEFLISLAWQMLDKNLSHKEALEVCKLLKLNPEQVEFLDEFLNLQFDAAMTAHY